jgi:hypothetical protein
MRRFQIRSLLPSVPRELEEQGDARRFVYGRRKERSRKARVKLPRKVGRSELRSRRGVEDFGFI